MDTIPPELTADDGRGGGRPQSPLAGERLGNEADVVERSRRPGPIQRVRNVWAYRELLVNFTGLQLKVKYKNSTLGFLWSLLNPALYIVVFGIVFGVFLPNNVPKFTLFLMSGLLVWNFFSTALGSGATSIVGSASLVTKVWFPREILPLAAVGAAAFHFVLQSIVLFAAMLVFQRMPSAEFAVLIPVALLAVLLLSAALAIALSAINVYLRDTQHLLELILVAWFWASAIVYPYGPVSQRLVDKGLPSWLLLVNPVVPIVLAFQRVIYNPPSFDPAIKTGPNAYVLPYHSLHWYLGLLGAVCVGSIILGVLALSLFGRLEDNFAEEI